MLLITLLCTSVFQVTRNERSNAHNFQRIVDTRVWATADSVSTLTILTAATSTTTTTTPLWSVGNVGKFAIAPGAALPSEAECARQVARTPETRSANAKANHTTPTHLTFDKNWGSNATANQYIRRVTGKRTGTTDELIQWASCKWGFDPEVTRAQVMVESSWRQAAVGGFIPIETCASSTTSTSAVDTTTTTTTTALQSGDTSTSTTSPCQTKPTAFGVLQLRSDYQPGTYPWSATSTAFNLDYSLAMRRACYDGVSWLGRQTKGDLWGCVGVHFSGGWYDSSANGYIERVKRALDAKAWRQF